MICVGEKTQVSEEEDDEFWKGIFGDDDETTKSKTTSSHKIEDDFQCRTCEDEFMSNEEGEAKAARKAMTPEQPTQKEIEEHELTHLPFRSWCVHCQRGKMKNAPHSKRRGVEPEDRAHPVISIDYMYLDVDYKRKSSEGYKKEIEGKRPILVVVDNITKTAFAHDMDAKGADDVTIEQIEEDIKCMGYQGTKIIIKGDQEPSIVAIQEKLINKRNEAQTVPENSPVGESSANGMVERTIQSVQGQIRTIKDQVETKTGRRISRDSTIFRWLVEWAAGTLTRYKVHGNGKTSIMMIKGRQSRAQISGFGEKVLYVPLKGSKIHAAKLEMRGEF